MVFLLGGGTEDVVRKKTKFEVWRLERLSLMLRVPKNLLEKPQHADTCGGDV